MTKMDSLRERMKAERMKAMERQEIINALQECNWVTRAARRLGITERMIGYKVKKYGIRVKEVRWIEYPGAE